MAEALAMTDPGPHPPVTVVMPTRNQAGYIARAVESVFAQAVPGLELCVQDGASSDGTPALLAALAARHPGLRWVSEPDGGPAEAVNRAVARARGEVIGWLNSDDLYTPGAVARALSHLQQHPRQVMVYGEGEHIDAEGAVIGRYPTCGPDTPLAAWADGCHICQPTAFFRRQAFIALGGLDTTLRTAFDYDFWLRLIKTHPGGVGQLPEVQAQSRLHAGAITLRLRETVAMEALQLIHRHIGPAPAHWLLTHFDEVMAGLPFDGSDEAPACRLLKLVQRAEPWLDAVAANYLHHFIAGHRALQLAAANFFAPLHADGWAGPLLTLRLRQEISAKVTALRLHGVHASPRGGPLHLQYTAADGIPHLHMEAGPGPFSLTLPLPEAPAGTHQVLAVECLNTFVPARLEPGSTDERELGYQVQHIERLMTP